MDTDEFEIKATCPDKEDRIWTRSKLSTAQFIADQAILRLGYAHAVVVNTFGGHRSDPLYVVSGKESSNGGDSKGTTDAGVG